MNQSVSSAEVDFIARDKDQFIVFGNIHTLYPINSTDLATKKYVDDRSYTSRVYGVFLVGTTRILFSMQLISGVIVMIIEPKTFVYDGPSGYTLTFTPEDPREDGYRAKSPYEKASSISINGKEDLGYFTMPAGAQFNLVYTADRLPTSSINFGDTISIPRTVLIYPMEEKVV